MKNYLRIDVKKGISILCVISIVLSLCIPSLFVSATTQTPDDFKGDLLFSEDFNDNTLEGTQFGGTWYAENGVAVTETGGGDAWYVLNAQAADFVYSADITKVEAAAVGISFRTSGDPSSNGYDFILDSSAGVAKLCMRPYSVINQVEFSVNGNQTYHIDIVAIGSSISIYVDGVLLIEATDATYTNGKISLYGFISKSTFDNVKLYSIKTEPTVVDTFKGDLLFSEDFNDNTIEGTPFGGNWYAENGVAVTETGGGDAWYVLNAQAADFVYSADVTLVEAASVGISFRISGEPSSNGYDFILDSSARVAKLCMRPYAVINQVAFDVIYNKTYHIDIVAKGSSISIYIDGELLFEVSDSTYTNGRIGLFGYVSKSTFDNVKLCGIKAEPTVVDTFKGDLLFSEDFNNTLEGTPVGGTWYAANGVAVTETGSGDAWYVLNAQAADFVYSADVTLVEANAVGISFRCNDNPSGNGYDFILESSNGVGTAKLCMRPYAVINQVAFDVIHNKTYHIDIVAKDSSISIYVDGELLFEVSDSTYKNGRICLFGYNSKSTFDNVKLYSIKAEPTVVDTFKGDLLFSEDFSDNTLEGVPVGGTWYAANGVAVTETGSGDAWYVLNGQAADFVYSADVTLVEANAVGISFRINDNPSGNGYDFILESSNGVGTAKLCMRPYAVINQVPFDVIHNKTYHIDIVAKGSSISIYVDGVLVIEVTDTTYTNGNIGLFGYNSKSTFDNVKLYSLKASEVEETLKGDYNGDGKVDIVDLIRLKKYLAGLDVEIELENDFDTDGIENNDLIKLRKFLLGYTEV